MLRPIACLGVLLLAAFAAEAGTSTSCTSCDWVAGKGRILYATAASPGRVDAFCVDPSGRLRPSTRGSITGLQSPRRLLVDQQNHRLYVAEANAVDAFEIKPGGGLARLWRFPSAQDFDTKAFRSTHLDLQDLALAADCTSLYVPAKKPGRILALTDLGNAPPTISSCAQGPAKPGYRNLIATSNVLYSSGSGSIGRIDAFRLGGNGELAGRWSDVDGGDCRPSTAKCSGGGKCKSCGNVSQKACPAECGAPICPIPRPPITTPDSTRRKLSKPLAFQILDSPPGAPNDRFLYVAERGNKQLIGFRLRPDGLFDDATRDGSEPQKPFTRVHTPVVYLDMVARRSDDPAQIAPTLVGSQFNDGLLESFALAAADDPSIAPGDCHITDGTPAPSVCLPEHPKSSTGQDLRLSPVRMQLCRNQDGDDWLYIATGIRDRIQAMRLSPAGRLETDTISEVSQSKGSFPNDVAIAVLDDACQ